MPDNHTNYIILIVVIIALFLIFSIGGYMLLSTETFNGSLKDSFKGITKYYNNLDNGLHNTSIVNVSAIDSGRYPIMIETATNWYNTQGVINDSLGTNLGKNNNCVFNCSRR
jgi:hypothetical protein